MKSKNAIDFHNETFNEFAQQYNKNSTFLERLEIWKFLLDKYVVKPGNAIDIGCGNGIFSRYLASLNQNVTAIDGAENMINQTIKNCNSAGFSINAFRGNIPSTLQNFSNSEFDIVIASSVLEYIEDSNEFLVYVSRIIKSGGLFFVSMPNPSSIYRVFERISFFILKKPSYLKFVKNFISPNKFINLLENYSLQLLHFEYFSCKKPFSVFTNQFGKTMYIAVFQRL